MRGDSTLVLTTKPGPARTSFRPAVVTKDLKIILKDKQASLNKP
jgi:hypothetical protein